MKIIVPLLLLLAVFSKSVFAATDSISIKIPPRPVPFKYVNDYANLLTPPQQDTLEANLKNYYKQSGNQIIIITLDSTGVADMSLLGDTIINRWALGKLNQDKCVLIVVDFYSKQAFIDLGRGIKAHMYEGTTFRVLNYHVLPYFKKNEYYEGLENGISDLKILMTPLNQVEHTGTKNYSFLIIILILIITLGGLYLIWKYKPKVSTRKKLSE